jgi:hypothetical protein
MYDELWSMKQDIKILQQMLTYILQQVIRQLICKDNYVTF